VLTYGVPGVTPNPITTIHATGAALSWQPYVNNTGDSGKDIASYQVYRSVFQSFVPASNTLVAPVPSTSTTFTDTSATPTPPGGLGNAYYYMVAVKTKDGTVIPGPVQLVRLPTAGSTTQIINASGATSLSSAQPTTNEQHITGQPWLSVGDDSSTFATTRSVLAFPAMASGGIPADATVSDAHLKLWGFLNDAAAGAKYDAYELTQSFDPATATWNSASSGTAWTTAGGTFNGTVLDQDTGFTNDPNRETWNVTSAAQDWLTTPADEHGLIVKLDSSAVAERELFLDTSAAAASLRPELVVTYSEPTAGDTYYAPSLPDPMSSSTSYTVPVTLTNTTASTWSSSDWVLSYHWLTPDGTDVSDSADQEQTALPASMAPSSVTTVNATVMTPDTSGSGDSRAGYELAWDLYDKTTGTWLSSGTSTPSLSAAGARRLGGNGKAVAEPMAQGNNTVASLKQAASVEQPSSDLLGLEKFYQYTGTDTGSGGSLLNNDDAGNAVWQYNAFSNPSRGFQTFVRMAYNSMDTSESSMGFGWSLQASTLQRLGTPLDFLPNKNPTTVKLTDGDGTSHLFTKNPDGTWQSPPGVHYYLQDVDSADCSANGKDPVSRAWLMTAPDRTQFWFDCNGYQTAVVDKNGNEADFTYSQRNSNNQPREFLDSITDPEGRQTLTINYYAKGDGYSYVDDSTGAVVQGTNLTDPDIIDQIKSITDISGRTITFLYDTEGLMSRMTDGDGTSAAKVFKFGYDMTQGNKNVKLVSITDPRGNTTNVSYYTAPQDPKFKWSTESVSDRLQRTTNFAYTEESGGGEQTVVTDPMQTATTYVLDSTGRPTQITNALNQVTTVGWDSDNNVTSMTEPNGAETTWTYDPNTGYPLTTRDAQANHDGTAGTTYTYQTSLNGHVAEPISEVSPQGREYTFAYDTNGNLTSTTLPDGNVSGATAGSYTSKYTYDSYGDELTSTDPDGNVTKYGPAFDPAGYPDTVTDPTGNVSSYVYSLTGEVTSSTVPGENTPAGTDTNGLTSTYTFDVFGRPTGSKVPQDQANGVYITTPSPVYDGNDNITQSTAPNGAVSTYAFDAGDEVTSQTAPPNSNSSSAPARTTTYSYNADGDMLTQTDPDGNVLGAPANSYTTSYGYDTLGEQTSVTDANGDKTGYAYDNVGNNTSVTDPLGHTIKYAYNLDNWPTAVTDATGNTQSTGYDLDGNVISKTDQNGSQTLYTIDPDGLMTQAQVPYSSSGGTTTYHTTQYKYDQDGNQTQVINPRGVASGTAGAFTQVTKYNADGQVAASLGAYAPNDPTYNQAPETDYTYYPTGQVHTVTAPPSSASTGPNVTSYDYFDNGWTKSSTDPWNVKSSYAYDSLGDQTQQSLSAAGGSLTRSDSWSYFPDGSLASRTNAGIPTGLDAEEVDNSDFDNTASTGTWTTQTSPNEQEGYNYQTHAAGSGTDQFSWHLNIPEDGTYSVYVKYPQVSGAATNASYQVSYSGGSATATVDQTQNAGTWVKLGSWAFTQAGTGQQVALSQNSGGTVSADAVKVVRDNSGDTNTATETYSYGYDANGQTTSISDSGAGSAQTSYAVTYDQVGETTGITQQDASGNTQHTTTFGYDKDGYLTSQVQDGQTTTSTYDERGLLSSVSVPKSMTDPTPQTTSYTYTPTGLTGTETKPNGNKVSYSYFLDGNQQSQTEDKSDGTLVASHAYAYDADGNMASDNEQVTSANSGGGTLSHTLDYAYSPSDKVTQVTKDGSASEKYGYDLDGNISSQTVNGASTTFAYDRNRLLTATTNGVASDYNYDPLGRLDSITTAGAIGSQYSYDGFDQVTKVTQYATGGSSSATDYAYDPLGRQTSQTTGAGTSSEKTTDYSYLGLSNELDQESVGGKVTKTYAYSPWGERLSQDTYDSSGNASTGQYSYNSHSDVEAVTDSSGNTQATYGYTAYGQADKSMFTGADASSGSGGSPGSSFNPYQFNADRADGAGGYNMGFRDYSSDTGRFLTPDGYDGALENQGLTANPFTGNPYGFGDGNPLSNVELDGHGWLSDLGHAALSVAGMVPVVGAAADIANAAWYAADGDYGDAIMSAAGAIPVIGDAVLADRVAVTGVKLAEDGAEIGDAALNDYRAAENTAKGVEDASDLAKTTENADNAAQDAQMAKQASAQAQEEAAQQAQAVKAAAQKAAAEKAAAAAAEKQAAAEGEAQSVAESAAGNEPGGSCPLSFSAGTQVLLANGQTAAISSLKPGDRVEATNTKTGKTTAEQLSAVEIRHDTGLYDLKVRSGGHTEVIHTTSNHPFWDPKTRNWVQAGKLRKGESLKTADGKTAVADGGTAPKNHDGWMWDITVPGDNDHDFYVVLTQLSQGVTSSAEADQAVLVHNCPSANDGSPAAGRGRAEDLHPAPSAAGDHTVFERGEDGVVTRYQTWLKNDRAPSGWQKGPRFRGTGGPHSGMEPPLYYPKGGGRAIPGVQVPENIPPGYLEG
jgi:RHS repeat-associated protein